jgi:hypothetical protein
MKRAAKWAAQVGGGNEGEWPKPGGLATPLGNRCAIPTFPPPRRLLDSFHTNQERSFPQPSPQPSFRLILRLEKTSGASLTFMIVPEPTCLRR